MAGFTDKTSGKKNVTMKDPKQVIPVITPDIYTRFRQAVELRKWPDGTRLTQQQLEICIQAMIRYEYEHLKPEDRTGYVEPKSSDCAIDGNADVEQELRWQK